MCDVLTSYHDSAADPIRQTLLNPAQCKPLQYNPGISSYNPLCIIITLLPLFLGPMTALMKTAKLVAESEASGADTAAAETEPKDGKKKEDGEGGEGEGDKDGKKKEDGEGGEGEGDKDGKKREGGGGEGEGEGGKQEGGDKEMVPAADGAKESEEVKADGKEESNGEKIEAGLQGDKKARLSIGVVEFESILELFLGPRAEK